MTPIRDLFAGESLDLPLRDGFNAVKLSSQVLLLKWRVPIIIALVLVILTLQILEYSFHHTAFLVLFLIELFVIVVLLLLIFLLFGLFRQAINEKDQTFQILELKHRLALGFSAAQDWDELVDRILQFLSSTIEITHASIELLDRSTSRFETIVERNYSGEPVELVFLSSIDACQQNSLAAPGPLRSLQTCVRINRDAVQCPLNGFCYPLLFNGVPVALVHFLLPTGASLTSEQTDILHYVNEEIAYALEGARQRRLLLDMQANKVAMEERLSIFRDLHDNLGQTLAFICLKLSQITQDGELPKELRENAELSKVNSAAQEAYDHLRDALVGLRRENLGELGDLIIERSRIVAERSKINIQVSTIGMARLLPSRVIRQIVYIFREALNNVERHAQAKNVEVQLKWSENELSLRIVDDGRGFDPGYIDKEGHYGLDIMNERVKQIDGQVSLNSMPEKGTEILLSVPISVRTVASESGITDN